MRRYWLTVHRYIAPPAAPHSGSPFSDNAWACAEAKSRAQLMQSWISIHCSCNCRFRQDAASTGLSWFGNTRTEARRGDEDCSGSTEVTLVGATSWPPAPPTTSRRRAAGRRRVALR